MDLNGHDFCYIICMGMIWLVTRLNKNIRMMSLKNELIRKVRDSYIYEFYYNYIWRPDYPSISAILDHWAMEKEDFSFIQVGANDGYTNDPIYKYVRLYDWTGVLVEPQKKCLRMS